MLTLESIFKYIRQKFKNMFILKFHPGMNFSVFFAWMSSSGDDILSRQKRINNKRHFIIDKDDFVAGRVSVRDKISRVCTILI